MRATRWLSCETLAVIIVVVGVVAVCLIGGVQYYRSKRAAAPFEGFEEEARAACSRCFSLSEKSAGAAPYRRGKVLVVEADTGEVTTVIGVTMADLPSEVRAISPEEVGTLVCAGEVQQLQVSTYQDREPAYKLYREICIYDLTAEEVILFDTLWGGPPPPIKTEKGPKSGPDPVHRELVSLLEGLPVK